MATACNEENELKDLVTCGVCMCLFDEEIRKPKFLPCSHTVCFLCLKVRNSLTLHKFHYSSKEFNAI